MHLGRFLMYFNVFRWLVISKMLTEVLGSCLLSCSEAQDTNHELCFDIAIIFIPAAFLGASCWEDNIIASCAAWHQSIHRRLPYVLFSL